jgi:adenylate cyclase
MSRSWLIVSSANGEHRVDLPAPGQVRVGRGVRNDLILNDDALSREHCLFQVAMDASVTVSDRGSTNGTFVNGTRSPGTKQLQDGDQVRIGSHLITIHCPFRPSTQVPAVSEEFTKVIVRQELISVLVVDVKGYTALSQVLDAELLMRIMAEFNRRGSDLVVGAGAWSIKFIGDCIMAIWLHADNEHVAPDLVRILKVLSDILRLVDELSGRLPAPHRLKVGAGLNTGPAQVGQLGSRLTSDFTALGETVNKAFRLEAATRVTGYDLMLGEQCQEALRASGCAVAALAPCQVTLKGYDSEVGAFGLGAQDLPSILRRP